MQEEQQRRKNTNLKNTNKDHNKYINADCKSTSKEHKQH